MEHKLITLDNGFDAIIVNTPIFRSIYAQISVRAGSGVETKENNGISHFLEHMILEGTEKYPDKDQFDEMIEYLGGSYNAYTSRSKIGIKIAVPDNHSDLALEYLHQVVTSATFPKKSYLSEQKAIIDEIYNYETDQYKKFNDFWKSKRFTPDSQPLEVAGTQALVEKITLEDIKEWYAKIMQPSNMSLIVVGNLDIEVIENTIRTMYGQMENTQPEIKIDDYHKSQPSNQLTATFVDPNQQQAIGSISYAGLSLFDNTIKERHTSRIVESVLANYRSSILYKRLRKELGLIYSISIDHGFGIKSPGIFELIFTTSAENLPTVYEIILEEIEKLRSKGLREDLLRLGINSGNNALKMGYTSLGQVVSWYSPSAFWFRQINTIEDTIKLREGIDTQFADEIINTIFDDKHRNIISRVNTKEEAEKIEAKVVDKQ